MSAHPPKKTGRGTVQNPDNRFDTLHREREASEEDPETLPSTSFLPDQSRSIVSFNDSPDVGFEASLNPYRGCEHGCIYCYARPTHEYLGFSAGLDFESKILVKERAAEQLRQTLASPRWKPKVLAMSGVTDPYQPIERRLELTRQCLAVLAEFRNPVVIITKNFLVTRDVDHLSELARFKAVAVFISLTTLRPDLCTLMEPRTSRPYRRLEAIARLNDAGIPVGVLVAPMIPGLTDDEIPSIIGEAARAGARFAGMVPLRLPLAVGPLFVDWLERYLPLQKEKILNRIRSIRDGRLNDPQFGSRMRGQGPYARQIEQLFELVCRKAGISQEVPELHTGHFRRAPQGQLSLF